MCHFIVDSLRAAWIGVGVAIVVAGDGVARTLAEKRLISLFDKNFIHFKTTATVWYGSIRRNNKKPLSKLYPVENIINRWRRWARIVSEGGDNDGDNIVVVCSVFDANK